MYNPNSAEVFPRGQEEDFPPLEWLLMYLTSTNANDFIFWSDDIVFNTQTANKNYKFSPEILDFASIPLKRSV